MLPSKLLSSLEHLREHSARTRRRNTDGDTKRLAVLAGLRTPASHGLVGLAHHGRSRDGKDDALSSA
jgi:hypothetical protein